MDRTQHINALYRAIAKSDTHKEYAERLKFFYGLKGQTIASRLKKACTYSVNHPEANFGEVYGSFMGLLKKDGKRFPKFV